MRVGLAIARRRLRGFGQDLFHRVRALLYCNHQGARSRRPRKPARVYPRGCDLCRRARPLQHAGRPIDHRRGRRRRSWACAGRRAAQDAHTADPEQARRRDDDRCIKLAWFRWCWRPVLACRRCPFRPSAWILTFSGGGPMCSHSSTRCFSSRPLFFAMQNKARRHLSAALVFHTHASESIQPWP